MWGTIVNALAIIAGSLVGILFRGGIPDKYNETVMKGIGLSVVLIGIMGGLKTQDLVLVIFSLAIGSILGEMLRIEDNLESLGNWLENKMGGKEGGIAKGFVAASLLFCVGSMAIVGSLESGLTGNHQTLYAKSVLDGITSIVFTSTLGIGVIFSSVALFLYQGFITLTASYMKIFLTEEVIREMSAIGGLLIMAIGFNILEFKRIKVGNMLPAIFIPLIYFILKLIYFRIIS
ncbi:hypothetical protein SAMN02745975_02824 [Geosporobacter subterraneus DSM 17957]|uniref:Membrane protein YdfK n=1 Tax=Geosporobacter subterraneus DSM 17957 TaxID=1121919 RepID=A0A1M6M064_9FIRM|nr:DUF554 domain-containing protein [Geosporobacter subterraneus]SHJ76673.1 hypothetical protein SAMN02745975_02824 [Geosporobacter subterraneus DSM 17957]